MLLSGDNGMHRTTSSIRVCYPRAMWHATLDVVRPCVQSKVDETCHVLVVLPCVLSKGKILDGIKRPNFSDHVCCQREILTLPQSTSSERV